MYYDDWMDSFWNGKTYSNKELYKKIQDYYEKCKVRNGYFYYFKGYIFCYNCCYYTKNVLI